MDEIINRYYEDNYYPNLDELYSILKKDKLAITKKQVKEFLDKQHVEQITKEIKKKKSDMGHIVAYFENQIWQLDIFVLQKHSKSNNGYGYILCVVDVFTRKAYVEVMKKKDNNDVMKAMKKIIVKADDIPTTIMCDVML